MSDGFRKVIASVFVLGDGVGIKNLFQKVFGSSRFDVQACLGVVEDWLTAVVIILEEKPNIQVR